MLSEVLLGGRSSGRAADFESAGCDFDRRPPSHCWGVAKMERQQALTLPSSVRITPPQPDFMCPIRSMDRIERYERSDHSSTLWWGTNIRPFVQLERAQPSEGWDSGSNPEGPTMGAGGRSARHLTVDQDHAGSTPVPRARFYESLWRSSTAFRFGAGKSITVPSSR